MSSADSDRVTYLEERIRQLEREHAVMLEFLDGLVESGELPDDAEKGAMEVIAQARSTAIERQSGVSS